MGKDKVYITLEVDDKGTAVVRKFDKNTQDAFNGMKAKSAAVGSKMNASFLKAAKGLGTIAAKAGMVGAKIASLGAAFAAAAGSFVLKKAIGEFGAFEAAMANAATLVDTSIISMKALETQVMALPSSLGSATENAKGLYQTLSAGIEPAKAVEFLGKAAKAAKAGLTDTFTAVDAGTTILNAFGMQTEDATKIYDLMFKTVEQGKTTFEELAGSVGKLSPIASAASVSAQEMFAALATLTKGGFKTSEASARMATALGTIIKPSKEASDMAGELGLQFNAQALKAQGLAGFLNSVKSATGGNIEQMAQLFGGMESLSVMLALTGKQSGEFTKILGEMENSAGSVDTAFGKQKVTMKALWETFQNSIGKQAIILGRELAPAIKGVIDDVSKWMEENKELIKTKIVEFAGLLAEKIKWARDNFSAFVPVLKGAMTIISGVARAFNAVGKAIGTTVAAVTLFIENMGKLKPVKWILKFMGKGSTEAPLSAKIEEMKARVWDFADYIDQFDPKFTVDFTPIGETSTADPKKATAGQLDAYREMYRDAGSLAKANYDLRLNLLQKQRDDYLAITGDQATVTAWYAAMEKDLILEKNQAILESTTSMTEGMAAAWENYIIQTKSDIEQLAELSIEFAQTIAQGIGDAYAQALLYGKDLGASFKDLMKSTAAMIISSLIEIGVQRMIQWVAAKILGITEATSRMATLAAETYAGAFAATAAIPIVGPAMAPGVAAASLATMLAGSTAAAASGGAIGAGVATYHTGGIVGRGSRPTRLVSPDVFAGAQRAHTGLGPDEKPVIVKNDEGIFTKEQMAAMGTGLGLEDRIDNHVHVYLDGREVTKAQLKLLEKDGMLLGRFQRALS